MTLWESILYGIISGIAEYLPVSSSAHQSILNQLFGIEGTEPIRNLLIRFAVLLALFTACRSMFSRLRKEKALAKRGRRSRTYTLKGLYDLRLVRTAALPLTAGLLFSVVTKKLDANPLLFSLILIVNGIIVLIPGYMRQGNKEASMMTGLDAILIGTAGALSALPGISRVGCIYSVATARGADKNHILNWALLLSVPAILLTAVMDLLDLFTLGFGTLSLPVLIGFLVCAVFAYIGARLGIALIRYLTFKTGYSGFAYYSWGMALFTFILYLIT